MTRSHFCRFARALLFMTALKASLHAAAAASVEMHGWKLLPSLPDKIGFGGMAAGVLNGRLVAVGGSQFAEKPLWLKGEKTFSDRIFVLADPAAKWTVSTTRLPEPIAGAASAATADAIYLAGGIDATTCSRHVWEMRAQGDSFVFTALPDLPRPVGYGAAAIVGQRLYVLGGLDTPASKAPSTEVWSIELPATRGKATWRREPDAPGAGGFVEAAASDGRDVYLFGGIGFDAAGKARPSSRAARLDVNAGKWEVLPDLPEPRVGISTPCPVVPGNKLFLVGGYSTVFPGPPREHPGFDAQTYFFDLTHRRWERGPLLPNAAVVDRDAPGDVGPAPMIGAPCVVWHDLVVVVGGEVRSSVRTPSVLAWPLARPVSP